MFKKVNSRVDLVKLEEDILKFWKEKDIFAKTLRKTEGGKRFVFYEGPPTANGAPGVHHVLSRVYKDIFPRYKTMKGYYVSRKAGWDTHGLPVELEIEKKLGINSKKEIEKIGIEEFNRLCRESVMSYEGEWKKMTERIGFWLDMDNAYFTFTNEYIETVWWILKTIWDRGLLYEGYKIVPYCPRCGTPLSSHEIAQGYKEVEDLSVILKFPHAEKANTYFLVWTTTPWTLISNVAAAISPDSTYVEVEYEGQNLILAEDLMESVLRGSKISGAADGMGDRKGGSSKIDGQDDKGKPPYSIIKRYHGRELVTTPYLPVYDYVNEDKKAESNTFRLIAADFVSTEEGTGIVHMAPAFGEDDMNAGRENGLPVVQMVDEEGKFRAEVDKFAGMATEEANPLIIEDLKERGLLFEVVKLKHSYPFCWRCDTRLMYYAKKSWYIKTSAIKEDLLASNEGVNWYPEHIKYGRFGNWLENNVDWALTRERFWGTPLPVWEDEAGHKVCIGSIEELREKGLNVPEDMDLHRPFVDEIVIKCDRCGREMKRVTDLIDVWFDSGSMPFAQYHYPFENKKLFKESYPADFICEAIDQTRGWFYTMLAISTLLFHKSSFKNVLVLGLINDETGQKMSKSRGNVVKPWDVLNKQGADALRWYFFTGVSPWVPKNFSFKAIDEVIRKFILTLWNTYSFFVIYANIDSFDPRAHDIPPADRPEIDRWIISELNRTVLSVNRLMDGFNVTESGRLIQDFVDILSNWYVRRSRRRFWKSEEDQDKISAYLTLYECLMSVACLCAPFIPFISEAIYQNLSAGERQGMESVHLKSYPQADENLIDSGLIFKMDTARRVVGLGRSIRSRINIKIRQPLQKVIIYFDDPDGKRKEAIEHFKDIIKSELNIREIEFTKDPGELVTYDIKPNLVLVGKKYGPLIPEIRKALESSNGALVADKVKNGKKVGLTINGSQVELEPGELLVNINAREGFGSESDGEFTVGLLTEITPELAGEGFARELVHQIQNFRKEAGFEIENTISTAIEAGREEMAIIDKFRDYISKETLSRKLGTDFSDGMSVYEAKVNGKTFRVGIKVTGSIV
ncbi:MAG: isoleucine--tRNA ligase [Actinobacteria bacterium]|nr:isoleucine--tRNA ligase [Actinomycetota bacterium]